MSDEPEVFDLLGTPFSLRCFRKEQQRRDELFYPYTPGDFSMRPPRQPVSDDDMSYPHDDPNWVDPDKKPKRKRRSRG